VHCFAGISRSAAFATAFLMYYRALTVDCANQLIRKARYQIYPNPGFRLQLEHYGEALTKSRYS
jgi:serine/threonine/tyrosine-interacting protein